MSSSLFLPRIPCYSYSRWIQKGGFHSKCEILAIDSATSFVASSRTQVVLTRERGKNGKLIDALEVAMEAGNGIHCLELPVIQHTRLPDSERASSLLQRKAFDWIVVTSPEAAVVFIDSWKAAGTPEVRIGVVGSGTAAVFEKLPPSLKRTLTVSFSPSKAIGKVLAAELPNHGRKNPRCTVLYPASAKASNEIEEGLTSRGFEVTRMNTYTTDVVSHVDESVLEEALLAPVVAVASPSAVRAWMSLIPESQRWDNAVACIGETTALAAKKLGLTNVFFPENPGLEGWVDAILEALRAEKKP
ncbi:hypothetical protein M569_06329 [Genlisea aurea]|uniref:Uroporphyrinogen-III synthase n=1 Tax=Genlisea aurea TaxID=192259 RepID=S8CNZ5_9LAMI|nr:hypothetical protein M569_06329 [Genlisea aurea]